MRYVLVLLILFSCCCSFAQEFGQYQFNKYLGVQQQIQNQRNMALRRQRMYQSNPTRNIQYPTSNNPYPNIQRGYTRPISARQRYSSNYYNQYYR